MTSMRTHLPMDSIPFVSRWSCRWSLTSRSAEYNLFMVDFDLESSILYMHSINSKDTETPSVKPWWCRTTLCGAVEQGSVQFQSENRRLKKTKICQKNREANGDHGYPWRGSLIVWEMVHVISLTRKRTTFGPFKVFPRGIPCLLRQTVRPLSCQLLHMVTYERTCSQTF